MRESGEIWARDCISIHAPREGSDHRETVFPHLYVISIHAPREGSDVHGQPQIRRRSDFYPRSPRGERRPPARTTSRGSIFLSTLPARGATRGPCQGRQDDCYFYPRSPRGERPGHYVSKTAWADFYPRSPRGERHVRASKSRFDYHFYPRSPRGERPATGQPHSRLLGISIHTPREGSDVHGPPDGRLVVISIHAPREGSDPGARTAGRCCH